ncbi:MAG: hypothetical protein M1831_006173 [Alyxoria varia]|nr:MAG: hypothetical protein M1831_006173 [Alyxoria varia]
MGQTYSVEPAKCAMLSEVIFGQDQPLPQPHETKWTCTHDGDLATDSHSASDILQHFRDEAWAEDRRDLFVRPYAPNQCGVLWAANDSPQTVGEITRVMICSPPGAPRNEYVTAGEFISTYEQFLTDCGASNNARVGGTVPFNDTKIPDDGSGNQTGGGNLYLQVDKDSCDPDVWYCAGTLNTEPPGYGPASKPQKYHIQNLGQVC